jgi:hypothetical protein
MFDRSTDPWQWPDLSPEELRELAEAGDGPRPGLPLFQYVAVRRCNQLRAEIDAGSGFAVLAAVRICGTHGLVMPEWLVLAFNCRYDAVLNCRAASWDDPKSFGRPYKKGAHITALRKARVKRFAVHSAVHEILSMEPRTAIDKALFERVGIPLGLGATLAEEYYYQAEALSGHIVGRTRQRRATNTGKKTKIAGRQRPRR